MPKPKKVTLEVGRFYRLIDLFGPMYIKKRKGSRTRIDPHIAKITKLSKNEFEPVECLLIDPETGETRKDKLSRDLFYDEIPKAAVEKILQTSIAIISSRMNKFLEE